MTPDKKPYWNQLRSKEVELLVALSRREGIEVEAEPDVYDESQLAAERELVIHSLDRESRLLGDVRAALKRLTEGTYGLCLKCDTEISPKRLNAVPWAALCLECQKTADSERHGDDPRMITRLTEAA